VRNNIELVFKYAIYILSATILGKSIVYLFMRIREILEPLINQEYIPLALLLLYLIFAIIWAVLVLFIGKRSKFFATVYIKSSIVMSIFSIVFLFSFYASYIPNFPPFEFVYFMHDLSIVIFLMGLSCLVIAKMTSDMKKR
jgi:hypothetical protein